MALVYHRVPHPDFVDLQHTTADKPEGFGWDNLGPRKPKFIALHRMWGTLRGTDAHFSSPTVGALTDYGVGVRSVDGAALDGHIHKYNDPLGHRSGWASGRVSAPYGDGLAIVNTYGVIAVNRDGVSIELSGYEHDVIDGEGWSELVKLVAYWVDFMEIPYTSLPLNPHTGINVLIWHQEFTLGTGKKCPFTWVMEHTDELYADVKAYLKAFQEGTAGAPVPVPVPPVVAARWANPVPIEALVQYSDDDARSVPAIILEGGNKFIFVDDEVEAIRTTPRRQFAQTRCKEVGPNITKGTRFAVTWLTVGDDGRDYYITPYWTRVLAQDTKRVND